MAELVVMAKDHGRMNVPPAKLQEYLEAGWVEIERVPMSDSETPPALVPAAEKPKASKPKAAA